MRTRILFGMSRMTRFLFTAHFVSAVVVAAPALADAGKPRWSANRVRADATSGRVELVGNATFQQDENVLSSDRIEYDQKSGTLTARGRTAYLTSTTQDSATEMRFAVQPDGSWKRLR